LTRCETNSRSGGSDLSRLCCGPERGIAALDALGHVPPPSRERRHWLVAPLAGASTFAGISGSLPACSIGNSALRLDRQFGDFGGDVVDAFAQQRISCARSPMSFRLLRNRVDFALQLDARKDCRRIATMTRSPRSKSCARKGRAREQLRFAVRIPSCSAKSSVQQQAESSWATERMENALLRERINDIAASRQTGDPARRPNSRSSHAAANLKCLRR